MRKKRREATKKRVVDDKVVERGVRVRVKWWNTAKREIGREGNLLADPGGCRGVLTTCSLPGLLWPRGGGKLH